MRDWRALLGDASVLRGESAQSNYGADTTGVTRRIACVLRVGDATQVAGIVRIAARCRVPLWPISTGRNWGYGTALPVRDDCVIVDLSGLSRIVDFDADLGVVTLEPGVTQAMLAEFLDRGGHPFMVPVTGAGPECSIVGNALERGYGITPYSDHWSAVTDLQAVLADGNVYSGAMREAGGADLARLYKWGIGPYFAGLFSQGGFGIVTRMSVLLARRPDCVKVCLFSLLEDRLLEPAVAATRTVLGRLPGIVGGINLMNRHRVLAMAAPWPHDRLGSDGLIPADVIEALGREYMVFPWTGFATLYGTKPVVAAAQKEIRRAFAGIASRLVFVSRGQARLIERITQRLPGGIGARLGKTAKTLASALEIAEGRPNETALPLAYWRNPKPLPAGRLDPARDGCGLIWFAPLVPMRPASVRAWVDLATRTMLAHRIEPLITLSSLGERVFDSTVPILFDLSDPAAAEAAAACNAELLDRAREIGVFPYRVGVGTQSSLAAMQPEAGEFHRRLRGALDEAGILAPGRYG